MTTVTHGADPDALRRLAEDMLNHAEFTLGVGIRTQRDLLAQRWSGPDADRARQHWESVELPRIQNTTRALAEAAGALLAHEAQQREASEQTNGAATPSGTPAPNPSPTAAGTDSSSLTSRARTLLDVVANGPELAQVAAVMAAGGRGAVTMTRGQYEFVSTLIAAHRPMVGGALRVAGHLGTALNVYDVAAGVRDDNWSQTAGGAGGLAVTALGGPVLGATWSTAYAGGTAIYDGIQGTTYGDALERRNEMAFDTLGAGGMFIVPGNLALAAWDVLTGKGRD